MGVGHERNLPEVWKGEMSAAELVLSDCQQIRLQLVHTAQMCSVCVRVCVHGRVQACKAGERGSGVVAARTCSSSCWTCSFSVFISWANFANKVSSLCRRAVTRGKLEAWTPGETGVGSSVFSSHSPQLLTILLLCCPPCWAHNGSGCRGHSWAGAAGAAVLLLGLHTVGSP